MRGVYRQVAAGQVPDAIRTVTTRARVKAIET